MPSSTPESTYNFTIRRSDDAPQLSWAFQDVDANGAPRFDEAGNPILLNLTGSAFVLTVRGAGVSLALRSADAQLLIDLEERAVTWAITTTQARRFPNGQPAAYELQRLIGGTSQVLATGTITGIGGLSNG